MSTFVVLVRHGHVDGIIPQHFRGRRDIPLSATGLAQAEQTARLIGSIPDVAGIWCSPLQRCVRTAEVIAGLCDVSVVPDPRLTDLDYGTWQGQSFDQVRARMPAAFDAWFATPALHHAPGGESLQAASARATAMLWTALDRLAGSTTVLVTHDSINRLLLLSMLRLPIDRYWHLRQDPGAVSLVERIGEDWTIHSLNQTAHLAPSYPA